MKKFFLTIGIISALGIVISLVGMIGMKFNFTNLGGQNNYQTYEKTYAESFTSLSIDHAIGKIRVSVSSEVEALTVTYQAQNDADVQLAVEEGQLSITTVGSNWKKQWWNIFQYVTLPTSMIVTIPETYTLDEFSLKITDGVAVVDSSLAPVQNYIVQAGALQTNNISGTSLSVSLAAGYWEAVGETTFEELDIEMKAGSFKIENNVCLNSHVNIQAGAGTMTMSSVRDAYGIEVTRSAAWMNVANQPAITGVLRTIDGAITASTLIVNFRSEV